MTLAISHIHTYLVPERASPEDPEGVRIPLRGKLYEIASEIFTNKAQILPLNVTFVPDADVGQQNEARTLIVAHGKRKSLESGMRLAKRLKEFTTGRSKSGLLMLMVGELSSASAVCICRFPAEEGIMANKTGRGLKVEFLEKVFLKDAHSFKSVIYEGVNVGGGCWSGRAIDRQINDTVREVSDYWIKGYLKSDYQTKPKAGTKRLADALKGAIAKAETADVKLELISLGIMLRNYNGKVLIPARLCLEAKLSEPAALAFGSSFPNKPCQGDPFEFDLEEYDIRINLRSVELDNGTIVMAPLGEFDEVVSIRPSKDGRSLVSSEGRIVKTLVRGIAK